MSDPVSPRVLWQKLAEHPRIDDLSAVVYASAMAAADERRGRLGDGLAELMTDQQLSFEDGDTDWGNALRGLEATDDLDGTMRAVLAALLARAVTAQPLEDSAAAQQLARRLAWLAAHSHTDALPWLDLACESLVDDERPARLWNGLAEVVRRGQADLDSRAGALAALAALLTSGHSTAQAVCSSLRSELRDPALRALAQLGTAVASAPPAAGEASPVPVGEQVEAAIEGEAVPAPMRAITLVLLALTGLLLLWTLWRIFARWLLRLRRPAQLRIEPAGVTVASSVALMGKTLRSRQTHIPVENLVRAVQEVRYPRLAVYWGLIALAVGSYIGVTFILYGSRAGSPSLLGLGAAVFGFGVLCDFVISVVLPGRAGKVRFVFVPRKGAKLAIAARDSATAAAALQALARRG